MNFDKEKTKKRLNSIWKAMNDMADQNNRAKARKTGRKLAKNAVKCPHCGSLNVEFMQNNRKGFSAGKAIAGAALTGGIGAAAGFAGKRGKNEWICLDCHNTFQTKK